MVTLSGPERLGLRRGGRTPAAAGTVQAWPGVHHVTALDECSLPLTLPCDPGVPAVALRPPWSLTTPHRTLVGLDLGPTEMRGDEGSRNNPVPRPSWPRPYSNGASHPKRRAGQLSGSSSLGPRSPARLQAGLGCPPPGPRPLLSAAGKGSTASCGAGGGREEGALATLLPRGHWGGSRGGQER